MNKTESRIAKLIESMSRGESGESALGGVCSWQGRCGEAHAGARSSALHLGQHLSTVQYSTVRAESSHCQGPVSPVSAHGYPHRQSATITPFLRSIPSLLSLDRGILVIFIAWP